MEIPRNEKLLVVVPFPVKEVTLSYPKNQLDFSNFPTVLIREDQWKNDLNIPLFISNNNCSCLRHATPNHIIDNSIVKPQNTQCENNQQNGVNQPSDFMQYMQTLQHNVPYIPQSKECSIPPNITVDANQVRPVGLVPPKVTMDTLGFQNGGQLAPNQNQRPNSLSLAPGIQPGIQPPKGNSITSIPPPGFATLDTIKEEPMDLDTTLGGRFKAIAPKAVPVPIAFDKIFDNFPNHLGKQSIPDHLSKQSDNNFTPFPAENGNIPKATKFKQTKLKKPKQKKNKTEPEIVKTLRSNMSPCWDKETKERAMNEMKEERINEWSAEVD